MKLHIIQPLTVLITLSSLFSCVLLVNGSSGSHGGRRNSVSSTDTTSSNTVFQQDDTQRMNKDTQPVNILQQQKHSRSSRNLETTVTNTSTTTISNAAVNSSNNNTTKKSSTTTTTTTSTSTESDNINVSAEGHLDELSNYLKSPVYVAAPVRAPITFPTIVTGPVSVVVPRTAPTTTWTKPVTKPVSKPVPVPVPVPVSVPVPVPVVVSKPVSVPITDTPEPTRTPRNSREPTRTPRRTPDPTRSPRNTRAPTTTTTSVPTLVPTLLVSDIVTFLQSDNGTTMEDTTTTTTTTTTNTSIVFGTTTTQDTNTSNTTFDPADMDNNNNMTSSVTSTIHEHTIPDISMILENVGPLSNEELQMFRTITEEWTTQFYFQHQYDPNSIVKTLLVRDMNVSIAILHQNVTDTKNIITYNQHLSYMEYGLEQHDPTYYVQIPFRYDFALKDYGTRLQQTSSTTTTTLSQIILPIQVPTIGDTNDTAGATTDLDTSSNSISNKEQTNNKQKDTIISIVASTGILCTGLLVFFVCCYIIYSIYQQSKKEHCNVSKDPIGRINQDHHHHHNKTILLSPHNNNSNNNNVPSTKNRLWFTRVVQATGCQKTMLVDKETGGERMESPTRTTKHESIQTYHLTSTPSNDKDGKNHVSTTTTKGTTECYEKIFTIQAPRGTLGVSIDFSAAGCPIVHTVTKTSPLYNQLVQGDRLLCVDEVDVSKMPSKQILSLISTRSHQPIRTFQIARKQQRRSVRDRSNSNKVNATTNTKPIMTRSSSTPQAVTGTTATMAPPPMRKHHRSHTTSTAFPLANIQIKHPNEYDTDDVVSVLDDSSIRFHSP